MTRHDTPLDVASVLTKWVPKHARTILDPSVGTGALLAPILARANSELARVVAVDRDKQAVESVKVLFRQLGTPSLLPVCADFLDWAVPKSAAPKAGFDCVLMNPPFDARTKVTVSVLGSSAHASNVVRSVPIEVAFMLKAVDCTRPKGRVVAILPGSVISGETTKWLRDHLLRIGSFLYVHELPSFTFPGVESRVYLIAFEKSVARQEIVLCNHSLKKPDRLTISSSALGAESRLDYEFHEAARWTAHLQCALPDAGWVEFGSLAELKRGAHPDTKVASTIHSSAFREGFWVSPRTRSRKAGTESGVQKSDLLIRRVGRRCAESLGAMTGLGAVEWTDCVIRVRLQRPGDAARFLFAVRPLLGTRLGQRLVQRGSGATYLTVRDLGTLRVPSTLADVFPRQFTTYRAAVVEQRYDTMLEVEEELQALFQALLKAELPKAQVAIRRSG